MDSGNENGFRIVINGKVLRKKFNKLFSSYNADNRLYTENEGIISISNDNTLSSDIILSEEICVPQDKKQFVRVIETLFEKWVDEKKNDISEITKQIDAVEWRNFYSCYDQEVLEDMDIPEEQDNVGGFMSLEVFVYDGDHKDGLYRTKMEYLPQGQYAGMKEYLYGELIFPNVTEDNVYLEKNESTSDDTQSDITVAVNDFLYQVEKKCMIDDKEWFFLLTAAGSEIYYRATDISVMEYERKMQFGETLSSYEEEKYNASKRLFIGELYDGKLPSKTKNYNEVYQEMLPVMEKTLSNK